MSLRSFRQSSDYMELACKQLLWQHRSIYGLFRRWIGKGTNAKYFIASIQSWLYSQTPLFSLYTKQQFRFNFSSIDVFCTESGAGVPSLLWVKHSWYKVDHLPHLEPRPSSLRRSKVDSFQQLQSDLHSSSSYSSGLSR